VGSHHNAGSGRVPCEFFAAFCLVANGSYVATAVVSRIGDGATLLAGGSPEWSLVAFALFTAPTGFALWHKQGRHFGLGPSPCRVSGVDTCAVALLGFFLILLGAAR